MNQGIQIIKNSPNLQQRSFLSLSQQNIEQNDKQSEIISQLSIFQPELISKHSYDTQFLETHSNKKKQLQILNIQNILLAKSFTEREDDNNNPQIQQNIEDILKNEDSYLQYQTLSKQQSDLQQQHLSDLSGQQIQDIPKLQQQQILHQQQSQQQQQIQQLNTKTYKIDLDVIVESKKYIGSDQNIKENDSLVKQDQVSDGSIKEHFQKQLNEQNDIIKQIDELLSNNYDSQEDYQINQLQKQTKNTSLQLPQQFSQKLQQQNLHKRQQSSIITLTLPNIQKSDYEDECVVEKQSKSVIFLNEDHNSMKQNEISNQINIEQNLQNKKKIELKLDEIMSESQDNSENIEINQRSNIRKDTITNNQLIDDQSSKKEDHLLFSRNSSRKLTAQKIDASYDTSQSVNYDKLLHGVTMKIFDKEDYYPWYIMSPFSKYKSVWNILLLFFMFFNAMVVPVRLAFKNDFDLDFYVLDILIDTLFILEFLQSFITAFEDSEGKVVKSFKNIISNYMKGWFWIDFVSSIMVILMTTEEDQNIMRLFRIPKIYKQIKQTKLFYILKGGPILKFILFLKVNNHYMDILRFSVIIIFLIHIAGSLWYYVSTFTPKRNWFTNFYQAHDATIEIKYISSVYYVLSVLTTVGYGNITSQTRGEFIFTILFMFFAVVIYSWIIGVLTYSFFKINEKSTILKNRFIYFNKIVSNYKLNRQLQEKLLKTVQMEFTSTSNRKLDIFQNNQILKDLHEDIVSKVCEEIFSNIIKKIPFLVDKPANFISNIIKCVKSFHLNPGDLLYKKGDTPKDVFFLVNGRVVTKIQSSFLNFKTLVYVEGSFFGEVDLIFKRERKQSAFAETKCEIWRLSKADFFRIINYNEEIKSEVLHLAIKREEMLMKEEMKLLRAKLKENPQLNSVIFEDKPSPTPTKSKLYLKSQILASQQSIGEMINDEIAIQSKKKAYNSTFTKEMSLTDIIKISTKRLISSDDDLKDPSTTKDPYNISQTQIKDQALERMLNRINDQDDLSLEKEQIYDVSSVKKVIPYIQRACNLETKHSHQLNKDEELENVLKRSIKIIRANLK